MEEWFQNLAAILPKRAWPKMASPAHDAEARPAVIGSALDDFIGDWSKTEAREFLGDVAVFDQVDESLWK